MVDLFTEDEDVKLKNSDYSSKFFVLLRDFQLRLLFT